MVKSSVRQSAAGMVAEIELSFFKTAESISQSEETRTTFYTSAFLPTDQIQVETELIPNGSTSGPGAEKARDETDSVRYDI